MIQIYQHITTQLTVSAKSASRYFKRYLVQRYSMKKLLFIAGEPGAGKTERIAKPLKANCSVIILHTDSISKQAAKHYPSESRLGCRWQLWKLEFDNPNNHDALYAAFLESMKERRGKPPGQGCRLVVEGVLSGHPAFRRIMLRILRTLRFAPDEVATFTVCPPWGDVQRNLRKRGRAEDQQPDFIEARSQDYHERLANQTDVQRFTIADECCRAALGFLRSLPTCLTK